MGPVGTVRVILGAWVGMRCMIVTLTGHTHLLFGTYQGYICMHCMIVLFPGHTHYLGPFRVILGAWVGMHCMIATFPGHTHLLFGTFQVYIGGLGWYAMFDFDVSWSNHLLFWTCQGYMYIGYLGWFELNDCDVSWSYSLLGTC